MNATRAFFLVGGPGSEFFSKRLDQIPRHGNFRNGPLHVPPSRATARCLVAKHERPVQRQRDPDVRRTNLPLPLFRTGIGRSEEHTSELQSLTRISYAVFR